MANFEGFCPVRDILSQIGDKWSVLAMVAMQKYGVCRFRDFQKDMPDVSRKMLSQTLKRLEDFRLVSRTVYAEVPPRVEYRLTELGERTLSGACRPLPLGRPPRSFSYEIKATDIFGYIY